IQAIRTTFDQATFLQTISAALSDTVAIQAISTAFDQAAFLQTVSTALSDTVAIQAVGPAFGDAVGIQAIRAAFSDDWVGKSVCSEYRESEAKQELAFHDGVLQVF
ncbi:hypothetical protein ACNPP5_25000, partial [Pseudomonas sp. AGC67]